MTAGADSPVRRENLDMRTRFDAWLDRFKRTAGGFSVRTKILGIVLALTTVLGLGVTWQVRTVMNSVLADELEIRGRSVVSDLAVRTVDSILLNDTYSVFDILDDTVANHPDAIYGFVIAPDGAVLAHTFGDEGFPVELLSVNADEGNSDIGHFRFASDDGHVNDFSAPILDGEAGTVRVGLGEARLSRVVDGITTQMLVTTLFVGLAGVAAASLLTWLLTRPILNLVDVTRRVGEGDLTARASGWADDEIGALAVTFNQMVADLESNRDTIAENERARTRLLEQIISAQEEERRRISRELHDTVGQALSSLMVGITVLGRSEGNGSAARRDELQNLASETLTQVRQLGRELRPSALDDLGLAAALSRYAEDFEVLYPEISVDVHVDLPDRLPSTTETTLYRIVQEGMTNAARHSAGRTLSVLVTQRDGHVQTIIEDDGVGFDPAAMRRSGQGVGIHGMSERAELLGGDLAIESGADGTTVFVEVPA
jgi:signal transduction histidine kinase